jgi:hypothetical protein
VGYNNIDVDRIILHKEFKKGADWAKANIYVLFMV